MIPTFVVVLIVALTLETFSPVFFRWDLRRMMHSADRRGFGEEFMAELENIRYRATILGRSKRHISYTLTALHCDVMHTYAKLARLNRGL